jgi:L-asparaginase
MGARSSPKKGYSVSPVAGDGSCARVTVRQSAQALCATPVRLLSRQMAGPITVLVTRGDLVEARHRVHAIVVDGQRRVLVAGDPELVTFLRSSAKPIQALPVVRARPDLDDELIAVACASHLARPEQLAAVRRLLAEAPAQEDELECGGDPSPIEHNCSGKHAGFLALCRARGWSSKGYRLGSHPCQKAMHDEVAAAAGVDAAEIVTAVDGCGVVTFGLPLWRAAAMFGRLRTLEGGPRVATAMRAHPAMLRGPVAADALMIRSCEGWVAKGGAEGLFCACSQDGLGLALKVEDGAFRAVVPALAEVLRRLGVDPSGLGETPVENSQGERVGAVTVA